ncbi:MAG: hypothetical protein KJ799_13815 [Bacteroidetes bacterium]|nr:hypothetical protein [Bacteroidota bacterium]
MKVIIILIISLFLLLGCKSDNPVQPSENTNFLGKWFESFTLAYKYSGQPTLDRTTTIEFSKNEFNVKILPPWRTIISVDSTVNIGFANDTLFTGSYEFVNDTIVFYTDGSVEPISMRYWFNNDTLNFSALSKEEIIIVGSDTSTVTIAPLGVFLWSHSMMKLNGSFEKLKQ